MKTLLSHRSIRKYQNRPIEKEMLAQQGFLLQR